MRYQSIFIPSIEPDRLLAVHTLREVVCKTLANKLFICMGTFRRSRSSQLGDKTSRTRLASAVLMASGI